MSLPSIFDEQGTGPSEYEVPGISDVGSTLVISFLPKGQFRATKRPIIRAADDFHGFNDMLSSSSSFSSVFNKELLEFDRFLNSNFHDEEDVGSSVKGLFLVEPGVSPYTSFGDL
uniref:CSON006959 protein n=1 Tax=Culicoides sonorensis TaxID=179676 RepID=A0A336L9W4_CULSO